MDKDAIANARRIEQLQRARSAQLSGEGRDKLIEYVVVLREEIELLEDAMLKAYVALSDVSEVA